MERVDVWNQPRISEHEVQARVQAFLQSRRETKASTPYMVETDSTQDWLALAKNALRDATPEDRNPTQEEFMVHSRKYDPRIARVRKTTLFDPRMDQAWLTQMEETLATCQFGDPDPLHQLHEIWDKRDQKSRKGSKRNARS